MWLSKRISALALLLFVALSACGYSPALAPQGPAGELRRQVKMDAPSNQNEFDFVKQLEHRFGVGSVPRFRLSYSLDTVKDSVGVTPAQETVRINIFGKAAFSLRDIASGRLLMSGSVDTFTGYSVGAVDATTTPPSTNATISTLAAKRDAQTRLMTALADQVVTRLIATSADWLQ